MSRPAAVPAIARTFARCLWSSRTLAERLLWSQLPARLGRSPLVLITTANSGEGSASQISPSIVVGHFHVQRCGSPQPPACVSWSVPCLADRPPPRRPVARRLRDCSHPIRRLTIDWPTCRSACGGAYFRGGAPNAPSPSCSAMVCLPSCATTTCCWPLRAANLPPADFRTGC